MTKQKKLEYNKQWALKNPEKRRLSNERYRIKNRQKINENQRRVLKSRINDPEFRKQRNAYALKRFQQYLESWIGFIPRETNCQCCGKLIFFASQIKKNAIHFDHRNGKAKDILSPTGWLKRNKRNSQNELLWKSFDFGMLCRECNLFLPTNNRIEFIKRVVAYATA